MKTFRQILGAAALCFVASMFTGCDLFFDLIDNPINTTISMRTAEMKLQIGQQATRTATTLSPATITYASSDPAIATVDKGGTVTALKEGTTRITASVDAVDYWTAASVSYLVTVTDPNSSTTPEASAVKVSAVTINKPSTSILVGKTETLQVTSITPDDATDKTIVWSTNNASIATVDPTTGLVTGVSAGTATITATATQGTADTSDDVSASCAVTIGSNISYVRYTVSGTTATAVNDVALFGNYTVLENSTTDVTWSSGTYVVSGDVTINANVSLADEADVKLIICDGKELKVNSIEGKNATLTIYGQTASTGKLTADYTNASIEKDAIWVRYLHVHGGNIIAKSNNSSALSVGVANHPIKYGYLNLYHGQISATGGVDAYGFGLSGMIISGDLTVYSGNINAQGGVGTTTSEGGLFFYTQNDKAPQLNNYGGTIIAKGADATDATASPGINSLRKLSIVNNGTIKAFGGKSQNQDGGFGASLKTGGSLSGTGTMEITGGVGQYGGFGLFLYGNLEYQSGKLAILGGLKNAYNHRQKAIDAVFVNLTNKSGASVTFQVKTNSADWTNAPSATANNADFANNSSYVGVRVGY